VQALRANVQKWVPYSQRYLVLGLVGLALWLVSGIVLISTVVNKAPTSAGLPALSIRTHCSSTLHWKRTLCHSLHVSASESTFFLRMSQFLIYGHRQFKLSFALCRHNLKTKSQKQKNQQNPCHGNILLCVCA